MTMRIRYQVPDGGYGSDSSYRVEALCIDDGKMSFMDGWLNTKLGGGRGLSEDLWWCLSGVSRYIR
jgi:hypothetical protein